MNLQSLGSGELHSHQDRCSAQSTLMMQTTDNWRICIPLRDWIAALMTQSSVPPLSSAELAGPAGLDAFHTFAESKAVWVAFEKLATSISKGKSSKTDWMYLLMNFWPYLYTWRKKISKRTTQTLTITRLNSSQINISITWHANNLPNFLNQHQTNHSVRSNPQITCCPPLHKTA